MANGSFLQGFAGEHQRQQLLDIEAQKRQDAAEQQEYNNGFNLLGLSFKIKDPQRRSGIQKKALGMMDFGSDRLMEGGIPEGAAEDFFNMLKPVEDQFGKDGDINKYAESFRSIVSAIQQTDEEVPGFQTDILGERQGQAEATAKAQGIRVGEFRQDATLTPEQQGIAREQELDLLTRGGASDALLSGGGQGAKDTALENKIAVIQRANPGISLQEATGLATGTISIRSDEVSGTRFLVDAITGEERQLTSTDEAIQPPPSGTLVGKSLWENAGLSTGPVSSALAGASAITGTVGLPIAGKTIEARQFMQASQNDLIRALTLNPRFPIGEINRVKEEIKIAPKIIDNEPALKARMKAIDRALRTRVARDQVTAANNRLPIQARRDASQRVVDISNFLNTLGVPPTVNSPADFNSLPSGTIFIDPDGLERRKP